MPFLVIGLCGLGGGEGTYGTPCPINLWNHSANSAAKYQAKNPETIFPLFLSPKSQAKKSRNHIPKTPLYPYAKYQPKNPKPKIPVKPYSGNPKPKTKKKHLPPQIPVIPQPVNPKPQTQE